MLAWHSATRAEDYPRTSAYRRRGNRRRLTDNPTETRMPRDPQTLIFVGIKHSVVALDDRTGTEVWRTELRSGDYVTVLWDGEALIAGNSGEIWRLDPRNGHAMWRNELKGLGRGLVSMTSTRLPGLTAQEDLSAEKRRRDAAAAAAAAG